MTEPDFFLADAEAQARENPRSFFIPSREERETIEIGRPARLLFMLTSPGPDDPRAERMWVDVTGRDAGGGYVGTLSNQPYAITSLQQGDEIRFGPEHVIMLLVAWPLLEKYLFLSRRSDEDDLRPEYLYREDPDRDEDSGWRLFVGDETDEETEDADNILLQQVGYLVDRWPELRPVFETDPANGEWVWDDEAGGYVEIDAP